MKSVIINLDISHIEFCAYVMACIFFVSRLTFCRKSKEKVVWIGIWVNASNSEVNAANASNSELNAARQNLMLLAC